MGKTSMETRNYDCHNCIGCTNCYDCINCYICNNCINCEDCINCKNLENKSYYIDNEECKVKEYYKIVELMRKV